MVKHNSVKRIVQRRDNPPWWDARCAWLLKQKRKFLRLAKEKLSRDNWKIYKSYAAKVKRYMNYQARNYLGDLCEKAGKDTIYCIIKSLAEKTSSKAIFFEGRY